MREIKKIKEIKTIKTKKKQNQTTAIRNAVQLAALEGLNAMIKLYEVKEPEILRKGDYLANDSPGAKLSQFSAPEEGTGKGVKAAYASLIAAKKLKQS